MDEKKFKVLAIEIMSRLETRFAPTTNKQRQVLKSQMIIKKTIIEENIDMI